MKKLIYVMCMTFAASNIAFAFTPKPKKEMMPETTTTQKAAEAKEREGKTGTSNENAARQMREIEKAEKGNKK